MGTSATPRNAIRIRYKKKCHINGTQTLGVIARSQIIMLWHFFAVFRIVFESIKNKRKDAVPNIAEEILMFTKQIELEISRFFCVARFVSQWREEIANHLINPRTLATVSHSNLWPNNILKRS